MAAPNNRDWKAWEDREPPTPPGPTLRVTGEVETNNGAIVPELKPAVPPGINPSILILDLTLGDTGKPGTTDINYRPAQYEQEVSEGQYTQVEIYWEGEQIETVGVEIVQ